MEAQVTHDDDFENTFAKPLTCHWLSLTCKEVGKRVGLFAIDFVLVLGASVEMFLDKAWRLVGIRVGMFAVPFAEFANDVCCPFSRIDGFMDFFPVD